MYQDNRKWRHLYNHRWSKLSKQFLLNNPLCAMCLKLGKVTPSTVTDHIVPHKGDEKLFYDMENNCQALCKKCHDSHKARQENSGILPGVDQDGNPIDLAHPWHQE